MSFLAAIAAVAMIACNNDGADNAFNDKTDAAKNDNAATNNNVTRNTSTQDYAALADTFRMNSEAGNYLDPRTGKSIRIGVDPKTGTRYNAETNEPVWRYIDKRTWWVYSGDDENSMWDTVGTARMENNRLMYRGDNEQWVTYEKRWKEEDERRKGDWKKKYGDTKVKIGEDGDVKVKDESGKVKYDADDKKIKAESESSNNN